MRYDPLVAPDPAEWLALGEGEQLPAVLGAHKRAGIEEDAFHMHGVIHATIETQLAQGHARACAALRRLRKEGLDRHDAVHALGTVLAAHIHRALKGQAFDADAYNRGLDELTAESWLRIGDEE
jgi:hypothetical protein